MSIDIAALRPKLEASLGEQLQLGTLLGQGGFAAVFRAHDPFLERDVAIKVLDPSLAVDAALEEQFLHEARTIAAAEHPHIVPLYAAEAAGDILDLQRGSSSASLSDPLGTSEANITGTLLALIVIALYFASGCFDLTLRAIYDSYGIWPVRRFTPLLSREAGGLLLSLLDTIVSTGLLLVGPVVVCLLLVDLLFALIARAAPSLQPFYLSMTVKNLVFSLVLVLYGAFLIGYMKNGLVVFLDVKPQLEAIAPR